MLDGLTGGATDKGRNDPRIQELFREAQGKLLHHATESWIGHSSYFVGNMADSLRQLAQLAATSSQVSRSIAPSRAPSPPPVLPEIILDSPPRAISQPASRITRGRTLKSTRKSIAPVSQSPVGSRTSSKRGRSPKRVSFVYTFIYTQ